MERVFFYSADRPFLFGKKRRLKGFIPLVFKKEKREIDLISFIFCSDKYLLKINQDFLHHDYYTDIITFNLSESNNIIGEIYISVDRVKENARQAKVKYQEELLRIIIHGILHLCDYNDKTKSEISLMRNMEDRYLRLFEKLKEDV